MIALGGNWTHLIPKKRTPLRAAAPRGSHSNTHASRRVNGMETNRKISWWG